MSELLGWMIVVGLAVAIAGIFMLSTQIERHTRRTVELLLQSNAMIVAQLERADGSFLRPSEPFVGVVLERRRAERRNPMPGGLTVSGQERRVSPDRRLGEIPQH